MQNTKINHKKLRNSNYKNIHLCSKIIILLLKLVKIIIYKIKVGSGAYGCVIQADDKNAKTEKDR